MTEAISTQRLAAETRERLGTAVQSFIYKIDPVTKEVSFLLSRRNPKASTGYMDAYAPIGGMANKGEQQWQTQLREAREEFGAIADDKKRSVSENFKQAAWRLFHFRRLVAIDAILKKAITASHNGVAIHSQIHKPQNPDWDATEDTFKAVKLDPETFDRLVQLTKGYSTGNKEVTKYEEVKASDLFKYVTIPDELAMSMGIEKNAIIKLMEYVDSLKYALDNPIGAQKCLEDGKPTIRPIHAITDDHIKEGSEAVSHGARKFTPLVSDTFVFGLVDKHGNKKNEFVKVEQGETVTLACPVYFNAQGEKVMDWSDTYIVGEDALKDYQQVGETDIHIKKSNQTPVILLPHTVCEPSLVKISNEDILLPFGPGQRLIVRAGKIEIVSQRFIDAQVEVRTAPQVAHSLTLTQLPLQFRKPEPNPVGGVLLFPGICGLAPV